MPTAHGRTACGHTSHKRRPTRAPRCSRGAAHPRAPWRVRAGGRHTAAAAHAPPPCNASRPVTINPSWCSGFFHPSWCSGRLATPSPCSGRLAGLATCDRTAPRCAIATTPRRAPQCRCRPARRPLSRPSRVPCSCTACWHLRRNEKRRGHPQMTGGDVRPTAGRRDSAAAAAGGRWRIGMRTLPALVHAAGLEISTRVHHWREHDDVKRR